MIKHLLISFVLIINLMVVKSFAQNQTDYITRKVNLRALSLIDDYRNATTFVTVKKYNDFKKLFTGPDALIINDILPNNDLDNKIKIDEYIKLNEIYFSKSNSSDLKITGLSSTFDTAYAGKVLIEAAKFLNFLYKGITYQDTLDLQFEVSFNYLKDTYKINSINTTNKYGKYCIVNARVKGIFNSRALSNHIVLFNNSKITLDKDGNYFLKRIQENSINIIQTVDENIIGSNMIDYNLIGKNPLSDKNIYTVKFKQPIIVVQPIAGIFSGGASPIVFKSTESLKDVKLKENTSYSVALNIGLLVYQNSKFNIQFKTGFQYMSFNYDQEIESYFYYNSSIDPDKSIYIRKTKISNFKETNLIKCFSIPLGIQSSYEIYKHFSFFAAIGTSILNHISSVYSSSANASYSGFYSDFYNITISENGVYDFGNYNNIEDKGDLKFKKNLICYYGEFGISKKINRRLSISCSANYLKSKDVIFNENKMVLSTDYKNLNSISNLSNQYYIKSIFINLGLSIKI